MCGGIYLAVAYRINNGDYGVAYVFGYDSTMNPYMLKKSINDVWSEEKLVTNNDLQNYPKLLNFEFDTSRTIVEPYDFFTQMLCIRGSTGNSYGTYIITGYGEGTADRYKITPIAEMNMISITIAGREIVITNISESSYLKSTLMCIQGLSPNII